MFGGLIGIHVGNVVGRVIYTVDRLFKLREVEVVFMVEVGFILLFLILLLGDFHLGYNFIMYIGLILL